MIDEHTQSMNLRRYVGVPEGSLDIVVDGVHLAVVHEGAGPPVVCLHAIGHGGGDYAAFAAGLKGRFQMVRIDWPGHGRSGPDQCAVTPARYAQLLRGVVDQLNLATPIVVGCSIGGAAAIRYASEYPVRGLVLANSGGLVEPRPASERACRLMAAAFLAGTRGAWWFKLAFSLYYRMVLPSAAAHPQRKRIVNSAYEVAGVLASAWTGFAIPAIADLRERACALSAPIWVAWATQDRINRFADVYPTVKRMRYASVTQFRAGHAAFLETPEQFIDEFLNFVDRLPLTDRLAAPGAKMASA